MNRIFRKVWNHTLGRLVIASEAARSRGKSTVSGKVIGAVAGGVIALPLSTLAIGALTNSVDLENDTKLGNSDGNLVVSDEPGADPQEVSLDLANDITLDSVTTGDTKMDITGVAVGNVKLANNGLLIANGPSITQAGIDAANSVISNVGPGQAGTDAVNVNQLDAVKTQASAGWNVSDGSGNSSNIGSDGKVTFTGDSNVTVTESGTDDNSQISVALNDDLDADSVTTGNTSVTGDGVTVTGGSNADVKLTNGGLNNGSNKVTNVADGNVEEDGDDAVTTGQLWNLTEGGDGIKYFHANSEEADSEAVGDESVAIGPKSKSEGASSLAAGDGASTTATAEGGIALGQNAQAGTANADPGDGAGTIAIGRNSQAGGSSSAALGDGAKATADNAAAVGARAEASGGNATALGANATASGSNGIALGNATASSSNGLAAGNGAVADSPDGIALGTGAGKGTSGTVGGDQNSHVAIGNQAGRNVVGNQTTAIGFEAGSGVEGDNNLAIGTQAGTDVDGEANIAIGYQANQDAGVVKHATVVGSQASADSNSVALGYAAAANGADAVALGTSAEAASQGVALGGKAKAGGDGVALGFNSSALEPTGSVSSYLTGKTSDQGVVSVGNSSTADPITRRIVNVADGAQDNDAVNVNQLKALEDSLGSFKPESGGNVNYNADGGTISVDKATIDGHAVNLGQLNETVAEKGVKYFSVNSTDDANRDNNGATGANALAIGPQSSALGKESLALGYQARSDADTSVAIGKDVRAEGAKSTVLGNGSLVYGEGGVAIGEDALSKGKNSIVMGTRANSNRKTANDTADNAIVLGTDATSTAAQDGIAIGHSALAREDRAVAQGFTAHALADDAMAFGSNSKATGTRSTAMGTRAGASGTDSIAQGTDASASGTSASASGTGASASGKNAIASGTDSSSVATDGVAMGTGAVSGITNATSEEEKSNANTIAVGKKAKATDKDALAMGTGAAASAQDASAMGRNASASAQDAAALGRGAAAGKQGALAFGQGAEANVNAGDVALGAGSTTAEVVNTPSAEVDKNTYTYAGTSATSTVSVGTKGNERTVTNVAAGRVSETSTDAINGSQLYGTNQAVNALGENLDTAGQSVADSLGGTSSYDDAEHKVTAGLDVNGDNHTTVQDALDTASQGWDVSAEGNNPTNVAPGDSVDLNNSDGNIDISKAASDNDVTFDLANNLTADSLETGDTTVNGDGVTVTGGPNNDVKLTDSGLDNGGNKITNVADGDINAGSKDAVNGGQLNDVKTTAEAGWNVADTSGNSDNIGPNGTVTFAGDSNVTVSESGVEDDGKVTVALNDDLNVDSVTTGNSTLNNDGLTVDDGTNSTDYGADGITIAGGPSVTTGGIDAGDLKITGVADGDVNSTSSDAINGSQLQAAGDSLTDKVLGGNADYDGNDYSMTDVGGTGENTIDEAISSANTAANAGWDVADADGNSNNIGPDGTVTFEGDSNIGVTESGNDDDANVQVALNDDIAVDSVTTGNSVLDNDGLSVDDGSGNVTDVTATGTSVTDGTDSTDYGADGMTIAGGPSVTTGGIDAGGNKVTNVADGDVNNTSSDAINGSQLQAAGDSLTDKVLGGNADYDGNDFTMSDVGGTGEDTIDEAISSANTAANAGWNVTDGTNSSNIGPDGKVTFSGDSNISVAQSGQDDDGQVDIALNENIDLGDTGSVTTGGTEMNDDGVNVDDGTGNTTEVGAGSIEVAGGGNTIAIDASEGTIGGLTNQDIDYPEFADGSGRAASEEQLSQVDGELGDLADTPITFGGDTGETERLLGERLDVVTTNDNLSTEVTDDETLAIALNEDIDVDSVTTGGTEMNDDGVSVDDSAGHTTEVGAGSINVAGGGNTIAIDGDAGDITGLTNTDLNGNDFAQVGRSATEEQLDVVNQNANAGWNVATSDTTGTTSSNVGPEGEVDFVSSDNNLNIEHSRDADGSTSIDYALSDDVKLGGDLTVEGNSQLGDNFHVTESGDVNYTGPITDGDHITNKTYVDDAGAELVSKGMEFAGNEGADVHRDLGDTLAITGEGTTTGDYSGDNLKTVTNPTTGELELKLAASPKFGDVTINKDDSGRISGVTAGIDGKDAVNVDQLDDVDATANEGWNLTAQSANESNVGPGDSVDLSNTDGNIEIAKADTDNDVTFDLADDLTADSLETGDTTVNGDGVSVGDDVTLGDDGLTIADGPSVTTGGIDAGDSIISNVAPGQDDSDAVNVGQLGDTEIALTEKGLDFAGNEGGDVHRDLGETLAITGGANTTGDYSGDNLKTVTNPTTGELELQLAASPKFGDVTINKDDSGRISGVTAGIDGKDAVNVDQLDDVDATANEGWNLTAQSANESNVGPGDSVDLSNTDGNIEIAKADTDNDVTFDLADNLTADSLETGDTTINNDGLTIAGGPSVTTGGIDAGGSAITNVAPGIDGTDAVNVDQLGDTETALTDKGLDFAGNDGQQIHKDLGEQLNIVGGMDVADASSAANIKTIQNAAGELEIQLAASPKFGDVTINDEGKITGVADGDIAAGSKDAVNGGQLNDVSEVANAGWNVTDGTNSSNIGPDGKVTFSGDSNIGVAQNGVDDDGQVDITLNRDLDVDEVTAGDSTLDNSGLNVDDGTNSTNSTDYGADGMTIAGGPSVTTGGIDAGDLKITGVADGDVNSTSSDAINGSQLQASGDSLAENVLGGDAKYVDNDYSMTDVGGTGEDTIDEAISSANTAANAGWNVADTNGNSNNIGPEGKVTFEGDSNIGVTESGSDDDANVQVALNDDLNVDSVTTGNSTLDNDGLTVSDDAGNTSTVGSTQIVAGGSNEVTVDGDAGTVNGLTNQEWDGDNIVSGQAATEDQLQQASEGLTTEGLDFAGNEGGEVHRDLGETLSITGGANTTGDYSSDNLKTVTNSTTGEIELQLAASPKFGDVTINDNDEGKISGVADGENADDAVNFGQLEDVDATANAGWDVATSNTTGANTSNVAPEATVDFVSNDDSIAVEHSRDDATGNTSIDFALGNDLSVGGPGEEGQDGEDGFIGVNGADGETGVAINGKDGSIGLTGPKGEATIGVNGTNGSPGVSGDDGITRIVYKDGEGDPQEVATLEDGLKFVGDDGEEVTRQLNETLGLTGGADTDELTEDNIGITKDGDGGLKMQLAENVDLGKDGSVVTGDTTINNDGLTIVDGPTITNDGINMGGDKITNLALGEVNENSTDAVNGSQLWQVKDTANAGWDLTTDGDANSLSNVAPKDTVDFSGDGNVLVSNQGNDVSVSLNDSITLGDGDTAVTVNGEEGQVSVGDTIMDGDGLKIADGGPSVTTGGIDAGGMQIINVASGLGGQSLDQISGDDLMNAANVGDLQTVAGDIGDDVAEAKTEVTQGKNISIKESTGGDGQTRYEVATSDEVDFDKMEVGSVDIDKDNVDEDGNTIIAGVGKGEISADSTDAVNGSQLHGVKEEIDDIGGSLDGGMDFAADEGDAVNRKLGDTVAITGDDNITTRTGDDGVEVGLNRDLDVDSVTTGKTTVSNEGVTIEGGPSMTVDGIDGGGERITNVAPGVDATDAVNVGQMQNLNQQFRKRIKDVRDEANAGTASALAAASVPQAYLPGKSMVSAGAGTYSGESAVSVGMSRLSDNGRWAIKLNATADTQDNFGAGIGAGFHW